MKTSAVVVAVLANLILTACFVGDENAGKRASRREIVDAAARCGVPNFRPTKAGDAWAAYVEGERPDHGPKGDCIYANLKSQGKMATR